MRNGLNRFVWDLRHKNLPTIENVEIEGSYRGRFVVPGTYSAKLTINDKALPIQSFRVLTDPRQVKEVPSLVTPSAYQEQDAFLQKVSKDVEDIHVAVTQMRKIQQQLKEFISRTEDNASFSGLSKEASGILTKLKTWEEQLIQPKSKTNDDVINFVNKLSANFIFLKGESESNVPYITEGHKKRFDDLHAEWAKYQQQQTDLLTNEIRQFNEQCRKLNWNIISYEN